MAKKKRPKARAGRASDAPSRAQLNDVDLLSLAFERFDFGDTMFLFEHQIQSFPEPARSHLFAAFQAITRWRFDRRNAKKHLGHFGRVSDVSLARALYLMAPQTSIQGFAMAAAIRIGVDPVAVAEQVRRLPSRDFGGTPKWDSDALVRAALRAFGFDPNRARKAQQNAASALEREGQLGA